MDRLFLYSEVPILTCVCCPQLCADLPDGSDAITCKLKFEGPNVFEGVKAGIAADCFTLPVPDAITRMMSLASNNVTLDVTQDSS